MRLLLVHPSSLMYSEIFLRLEPLGLERVAGAARAAGHQVRVVDLQVFSPAELTRRWRAFRPHAVGISLNYLANVPEAIDIAARGESGPPGLLRVLRRAQRVLHRRRRAGPRRKGRVDAVVRGEGEAAIGPLLDAAPDGRPAHRARRGEPGRPGPADLPGPAQLDSPARAGPDAPPPPVLHRRARPVRLDRVQPRLPVGLLVLLGLDVLRPRLPQGLAEAAAAEVASIARAERVHRRRRGLHPARARPRHRRRTGAAAHPQAVLPGDPQRRPAAQPGGLRAVDAAWA